jgi:hypothetical protein
MSLEMNSAVYSIYLWERSIDEVSSSHNACTVELILHKLLFLDDKKHFKVRIGVVSSSSNRMAVLVLDSGLDLLGFRSFATADMC